MGAVVTFPGRPLVSVLSVPGEHTVMVAKPGSTSGSPQCSFDTLSAAVEEAQAAAEQCGWAYLGVFDRERIDRIANWRGDGDADEAPSRTEPGPSAA